LLTAVAALAVAASPACGPLDLETVLSLAATRNDEVAIRRAELEAARADVAMANALQIVPDAHATFLVGPAPGARGNVVSSPDSNRHPLRNLAPFERVEVDVVQPLFTWGRLDGTSDAALAGAEGRALMVQDDLARVQERIIRLFWAEALARRLLAIAADVEQALAEADRRVARSLERSDGEITPSDRYRVALFRGSVRQRTADARRALSLARTGLAASLSLPVERLSLEETRLEVQDESIPSAEEARLGAEASRRDLKALGFAIAAKEAQIRVEEAAALPQIFVGGRLAYSHAANRDLQVNPWVPDYFNEFLAGFAVGVRQDLAFPLLAARASKARAEKAAMERQREALSGLVIAEVNGALADLRAAADRLEAARGTSSSGKSWFRAASLDFSAGLIDPRDLVEAYAGYVESQVWLAQASYDVLVARSRLALVTGALPVAGEPRCDLQ
jgi:outer membrane protein TolC